MLFRKVTRDINEDARDLARALMGTPEFDRSRDERKKVEMRFAHLKTHHRFERMRLRGLSGARDEFHLAAIVQNLKTLAIRIWRPAAEPPGRVRCVTIRSAQHPSALDALATARRPSNVQTEGLAQIIDHFINGIGQERRMWSAATAVQCPQCSDRDRSAALRGNRRSAPFARQMTACTCGRRTPATSSKSKEGFLHHSRFRR
jgi:hypothetical protein